MKKLMVYVFFAFSTYGCSTIPRYAKNSRQVYFTSAQFVNGVESEKKVKKFSLDFGVLASNLTIKYTDGSRSLVPKTNVWGIRGKSGIVYRYNIRQNDFNPLEAMDAVVIYRRDGSLISRTKRLFSETLDSRIYWFTKRNLRKHAPDSTYKKVMADKRLRKWL